MQTIKVQKNNSKEKKQLNFLLDDILVKDLNNVCDHFNLTKTDFIKQMIIQAKEAMKEDK